MVLDNTSNSHHERAEGERVLFIPYHPYYTVRMLPAHIVRRRILRGDWFAKVSALNITPVKVNVNLIKSQKEKYHGKLVLEHHNYPLDEPIVVQKKPHKDPDHYRIIDGHHRYQQALDLGHTEILTIIVPWPTPKPNVKT